MYIDIYTTISIICWSIITQMTTKIIIPILSTTTASQKQLKSMQYFRIHRFSRVAWKYAMIFDQIYAYALAAEAARSCLAIVWAKSQSQSESQSQSQSQNKRQLLPIKILILCTICHLNWPPHIYRYTHTRTHLHNSMQIPWLERLCWCRWLARGLGRQVAVERQLTCRWQRRCLRR